jgi:hypothetical protein
VTYFPGNKDQFVGNYLEFVVPCTVNDASVERESNAESQ